MKKALLLPLTAAAATLLLAGNAMACSPGYKSVKIQGNWVCMLDASASNNLTSQPQPPQPSAELAKTSAQKRMLKLKRTN
jgi:hypothetical protein